MSALYQIISNVLLAIGLPLSQDTFESKGDTINAVASGQHWNDCLRQTEMFSHPTLSSES